MESQVIRVEYWGGPYDGQIEDIGSEYGSPQYQVLTKPSVQSKPVFVRGEDMRKDKPPAPNMVLWQYQGNRNDAIHNGRMIMRVVAQKGSKTE